MRFAAPCNSQRRRRQRKNGTRAPFVAVALVTDRLSTSVGSPKERTKEVKATIARRIRLSCSGFNQCLHHHQAQQSKKTIDDKSCPSSSVTLRKRLIVIEAEMQTNKGSKSVKKRSHRRRSQGRADEGGASVSAAHMVASEGGASVPARHQAMHMTTFMDADADAMSSSGMYRGSC